MGALANIFAITPRGGGGVWICLMSVACHLNWVLCFTPDHTWSCVCHRLPIACHFNWSYLVNWSSLPANVYVTWLYVLWATKFIGEYQLLQFCVRKCLRNDLIHYTAPQPLSLIDPRGGYWLWSTWMLQSVLHSVCSTSSSYKDVRRFTPLIGTGHITSNVILVAVLISPPCPLG